MSSSTSPPNPTIPLRSSSTRHSNSSRITMQQLEQRIVNEGGGKSGGTGGEGRGNEGGIGGTSGGGGKLPLSSSRPTSALPVLGGFDEFDELEGIVRSGAGGVNEKQKHTITSLSENNMDSAPHRELYAKGLEMRKKVVGEDYVERALEKGSSDFMRPLQQYATEAAWGTIWTRPGLELKTRSLLNLVMLTALGKWIELGTHVRGAVRNGCSELEIREALLQATAYCGMPAGMEAFRVADRVLTEMKGKGEL